MQKVGSGDSEGYAAFIFCPVIFKLDEKMNLSSDSWFEESLITSLFTKMLSGFRENNKYGSVS